MKSADKTILKILAKNGWPDWCWTKIKCENSPWRALSTREPVPPGCFPRICSFNLKKEQTMLLTASQSIFIQPQNNTTLSKICGNIRSGQQKVTGSLAGKQAYAASKWKNVISNSRTKQDKEYTTCPHVPNPSGSYPEFSLVFSTSSCALSSTFCATLSRVSWIVGDSFSARTTTGRSLEIVRENVRLETCREETRAVLGATEVKEGAKACIFAFTKSLPVVYKR